MPCMTQQPVRWCGTGVESVKFNVGALASGRDPGEGFARMWLTHRIGLEVKQPRWVVQRSQNSGHIPTMPLPVRDPRELKARI